MRESYYLSERVIHTTWGLGRIKSYDLASDESIFVSFDEETDYGSGDLCVSKACLKPAGFSLDPFFDKSDGLWFIALSRSPWFPTEEPEIAEAIKLFATETGLSPFLSFEEAQEAASAAGKVFLEHAKKHYAEAKRA